MKTKEKTKAGSCSLLSIIFLALLLYGTDATAELKIPSFGDLRNIQQKVTKKKKPEPPLREISRNAGPVPTTKRALVTIPPQPPGTELTFHPARENSFTQPDPTKVALEQQKRTKALLADWKSIGPIENLPAIGSPDFQQLRAAAFAIVNRRFDENRTALESDTEVAYAASVTWQPNFSIPSQPPSAADQARAEEASNSVAYLITYLDRPHFIVAYAAAVFALDPDSVLAAENIASAIVTSGERLHPNSGNTAKLKSYREDAATVYRYALARSVTNERWTFRSLDVLTNLGNLYVDLEDAAQALPVLLAARAYAPDSWDAALGLASCYEMQGRPELARATLEDEQLNRPALYAALARSARNLTETQKANELTPESPEDSIESILEKFEKQETITAADFMEEFDQSARNKLRYFVDHLAVEGSYQSPEIDDLSQFSSLRAINAPHGKEALSNFVERLGSYSMFLIANLTEQSMEGLNRFGMNVQLDVDINDVMAHPEKYQNRQIHSTVAGTDQVRANAEEQLRVAQQTRRDLSNGNADSAILNAARHDPDLAVFALKPLDYANPMDVMLQQYNMTVLNRKMHAYNAYFFAVNKRTHKTLDEIATRHVKKIAAIHSQEGAALAEFYKMRNAAQRAGQDTDSVEWRWREHNIHRSYAPQYNDIAEHDWKSATQVVDITYERKIKIQAERFYYDVFRHVALISDPIVRQKKAEELAQILHFAVYKGLLNVAVAYSSYEYVEGWDCKCSLDELTAQSKAEQAEMDKIENARIARDQQAKLRFASGVLPESTPLFKKLDAYGADLNIPYIPMLSGRISCARTTMNLKANFPVNLSPTIDYSFTKSGLTGATTHSGGVGVSANAVDGGSKIAATLNVKGSVSFDGKGLVSDYSITAESKVKVEVGPATLNAGGVIGYTPKGGLASDATVDGTISFSDSKGRSLELSVIASAQRGSIWSAKAEHEFNPYADSMNKAVKKALGDLSKEFPVDASVKREFWNGSFTL